MRIGITVLYILFLVPSLYAFAAVTELVLRMGHGVGSYEAYGRTSGEAALAVTLMLLYAIWLTLGTVCAIKVFKRQWKLLWLGVLTVVAWFVMMPAIVFFLLGVGHS
jgi:hypothetical protein